MWPKGTTANAISCDSGFFEINSLPRRINAFSNNTKPLLGTTIMQSVSNYWLTVRERPWLNDAKSSRLFSVHFQRCNRLFNFVSASNFHDSTKFSAACKRHSWSPSKATTCKLWRCLRSPVGFSKLFHSLVETNSVRHLSFERHPCWRRCHIITINTTAYCKYCSHGIHILCWLRFPQLCSSEQHFLSEKCFPQSEFFSYTRIKHTSMTTKKTNNYYIQNDPHSLQFSIQVATPLELSDAN